MCGQGGQRRCCNIGIAVCNSGPLHSVLVTQQQCAEEETAVAVCGRKQKQRRAEEETAVAVCGRKQKQRRAEEETAVAVPESRNRAKLKEKQLYPPFTAHLSPLGMARCEPRVAARHYCCHAACVVPRLAYSALEVHINFRTGRNQKVGTNSR